MRRGAWIHVARPLIFAVFISLYAISWLGGKGNQAALAQSDAGDSGGGDGGGTPPPTEVQLTLSPKDAVLASSTGPVLYTSGDMFLVNPVEGCAIFVTIVLIASFIELVIDKLKAIESDYFQMVLQSIQEETLIVGLMTLMLIFVITLGELRLKWVILLNYAVMSLLFMIAFFVAILAACAVVLRVQAARWREFEGARMEKDPVKTRREVVFTNCQARFKESVIKAGIRYYPQMFFSEYMRRVEKYTVANISDLSWKSWGLLSLLVVMNGVRAKIAIGDETTTDNMSREDRTINILSYILFVGYLPLAIYIVLHFLLQQRLATYAEKGPEHAEHPSELLFFKKLDSTCHIFQTVILTMEWYLAIFALGVVKEAWSEYGVAALGFYALAIGPAIVFINLLPWTITAITMLTYLGDDLHVEEATAFSQEIREQLGRQGDMTGGGGAPEDQEMIVKQQHAAVADEWYGEGLVSLHDTAKDAKILDSTAPIMTASASTVHGRDHNTHVKTFQPKQERPIFRPLQAHELALPGDTTIITYGTQVPQATSGAASPSLNSGNRAAGLGRQQQPQPSSFRSPPSFLKRSTSSNSFQGGGSFSLGRRGTGVSSPTTNGGGMDYSLPLALRQGGRNSMGDSASLHPNYSFAGEMMQSVTSFSQSPPGSPVSDDSAL